MVGRYNSLFGIDMEILKDSKLLERCAKNGRGQGCDKCFYPHRGRIRFPLDVIV